MLSGTRGCHGPSRAPPAPPRTVRTLEAACRRPSTSTKSCHPPLSPACGDRGPPGDWTPASGGGRGKGQQPSVCHLAHPPPSRQHLHRGCSLLPSDTSSPQTSTFQALLVPSPGPWFYSPSIPWPEDPLLAPPLTQGGRARPVSTPKPIQRWVPILCLPGSKGREVTADAFTSLFPRMVRPTRETGQGGRAVGRAQGTRPTDAPQPLRCAQPPAQH